MTEIEDLIEQARAVLKRWRKPNLDDWKLPRARSWRKILEERQYPGGAGHKTK